MITMSNAELAKEYLRKAYNYQLNGRNDQAIINYNLSIQLSPSAEAYTHLGYVYALEGKYEDSIQQCKLAIEIDSKFGSAYFITGFCLMKLGDLENSINWLKKAIAAPNYDEKHKPYFYLGRIYKQKGEWSKAINYFKDCLRFKPDYLEAKKEFYKIVASMN